MNDQPPIRVMLVDDHMMVRRGLAAMLMAFDDLKLVGEAADGETALQLCGELLPNVILMDLVLPGISGTTAVREIRRHYPTVRAILLTSYEDVAFVREAIEAGAVGYLLKDISAGRLAEAIRAVSAGLDAVSPRILQDLVGVVTPTLPEALDDSDLTPREKEVLALMVNGLSNREIADRLIVGASTIKSHVSNILNKLDVATRTEAVALALRRQLVM